MCPRCGGAINKQWGGIASQYYCAKCGVILASPGRRKHLSETEIIKEMERVWSVLGRDTVKALPFIETVRKNLGVPRLSVTKYMLYQNGFDINNGIITRRLQ